MNIVWSALGLLCVVQGMACQPLAEPTDPPDGPTSICDGVINSFCLTPDDDCRTRSSPRYGLQDPAVKAYIVAMHNMFRSKVAAGGEMRGSPGPQPPTECMRALSWDDDLATAAQNFADQCDLFNVDQYNYKLGPIPDGLSATVGQNRYVMIEKNERVGAIKAPPLFPDLYYWNLTLYTWYEEVTRFSNAKVKDFRQTVASNYTQMVSGATTSVGCGFRRAKLQNEDTGDHGRMLLCYYWPAGNQVGREVYVQRPLKAPYPACSTCKGFLPPVFVNTRMRGELCYGSTSVPPSVSTSTTPTTFYPI